MTRSDNRRRDRTRPAPLAMAGAIATAVGLLAFLVLAGVVASRAATDALRRGDALARLAAPSTGTATGVAAGPARAAKAAAAATRINATGPGAPATAPRAAAAAAHAPDTRPAAPSSVSAPGRAAAADASLPHVVAPAVGASASATATAILTAGSYVAPTVIGTALTGCTVGAGGGVVTYTVAFRGGRNWAPGSTFAHGAYTLDVVGGSGAHSGLDAVINGVPVADTADGVQTYVVFPAGLVLEARC